MKMKEKIEITQADMLTMLVDKLKFLTDEYKKLYDSYEYVGRGKAKVDPLKVEDSYRRFLKEQGDVNRILGMFDMFNDVNNTKKTATTKE